MHRSVRSLARSTALIAAVSLAAVQVFAGHSSSPTNNRRSDHKRPRPTVIADDGLARTRLAYLAEHSPTARQMLEVLAGVPGLVLHVASSPALKSATGFHGLGRLRVTKEGTVLGRVEFDVNHTDARRQLASLAHELAHVVEVVCRCSETGTRAILTLRQSSGEYDARSLVETPFAVAVGEQVFEELHRPSGTAGALARLIGEHQLALPDPDPP